MNPTIGQARVDEAEQILELQYLCYQSEAALYADYPIPPLTQALEGLLREYDTRTILVARLGEEVVGSAGGRPEGGTCCVGRVVVHPRLRRRGLGTMLMREIEGRFAEAERYELFTGHLSEGNLTLYRGLGYSEFRQEKVSSRSRMVYMQKARS